jgi:predicted amidophosphoribosyltransferase
MASTNPSCPYCGSEVTPSQRRCRECDSWLTWRAFLFYPDTIWSQLGVLVTIGAAIVAWLHALEARADRLAAEALRQDVGTVAEHVTKLAVVVTDASVRTGAMPAAHQQQIEREKQALLPHLSAGFDSEVRRLLSDLDRNPAAAGGR